MEAVSIGEIELVNLEAKEVHVVVRIPASTIVAFLDTMDKATIESSLPKETTDKFNTLLEFMQKIEEGLRDGGINKVRV